MGNLHLQIQPCDSRPAVRSGVSWGQVKIPGETPSLLPKFSSSGSHIMSVLCLSSHKTCTLLWVLSLSLCFQHFCGIFFLTRQVPWDFCLSETHPADSAWEVFDLLPPVIPTGTLFLINVSIPKHFNDAPAGDPGALSSYFRD